MKPPIMKRTSALLWGTQTCRILVLTTKRHSLHVIVRRLLVWGTDRVIKHWDLMVLMVLVVIVVVAIVVGLTRCLWHSLMWEKRVLLVCKSELRVLKPFHYPNLSIITPISVSLSLLLLVYKGQ